MRQAKCSWTPLLSWWPKADQNIPNPATGAAVRVRKVESHLPLNRSGAPLPPSSPLGERPPRSADRPTRPLRRLQTREGRTVTPNTAPGTRSTQTAVLGYRASSARRRHIISHPLVLPDNPLEHAPNVEHSKS